MAAVQFDNIPHELTSLDQWVCWQYQPDPKNPKKLRKLPIDPNTGRAAKSNDASTWASYAVAVGLLDKVALDGIGFMFSSADPFCGIDLDDCIDASGQLHPAAARLVELCNSYTEISPSGTGLKIFGVGHIPKAYKPTASQGWGGAIEVYSEGRYFTLTGNHLASTPTTLGNMQTALDAIVPTSQPAAPVASAAPAAAQPAASGVASAVTLNLSTLGPYYVAWRANTIQRAIRLAANAPIGQRHNERLKAGRLLGGLVALALLDRDEAAQLIYDANPPQANEKGEIASIYAAIDEGAKTPLELPTPNPTSTTYKGQPTSQPAAPVASAAPAAAQPAASGQHWPNALDLYTIPQTGLNHKQIMAYCREGQIGAARLVAFMHKDTLAFDASHTKQGWYVWNGQRWQADQANTVWHIISAHVGATWLALAASLHPRLAASTDPIEQESLKTDISTLQKAAKKLNEAKELAAITKLAAGLLTVDASEWDANPYMLGVANGYIDLRSGQLVAPNPTYKIRKIAPTAFVGLGAGQPTAWLNFLNELFPTNSEYAAVPAYLQRLFGLGVLGKKPDHVLPILWGEGRNGKGTMLETLRKVLGDYMRPASQDLVLDSDKMRSGGAASPHWLALQGLRVTWASETNQGAKFNMASTKRLSGGDTINARGLHQHEITFEPTHMFMLLTNHKPKADANDHAFWSRAHLIPFIYRFLHDHERTGASYERPINTNLSTELIDEASDILSWLIEGCLEYQRIGLQPPAAVLAASKEYRNDEDYLGEFVANYIVPDITASGTNAKEIYTAWAAYCEDAGLFKGSAISFGKKIKPRLLELGARLTRAASGAVWNGIIIDLNGAAASYPASAGVGAVGVGSNQPTSQTASMVIDSEGLTSPIAQSITSVLDDSNHQNHNDVIDVIDNSQNLAVKEKNSSSKKIENQGSHLSPATVIAHHKAKKTVVIDEQTALNDLSLSITQAIAAASQSPTAAHKLLRGALFSAGVVANTNPNAYQGLVSQLEQAAQNLGVDLNKPSTLF